MYMLNCCCESLGTPLDYSIVIDGVSTDHRMHDDVGSYGTHPGGPESELVSTGAADGKQLLPVDTTTTAEESTLFTEQCQAFKELPAEQASQTPEGPREPDFATANAPEVNQQNGTPQNAEGVAPIAASIPQMNHEHEMQPETDAAATIAPRVPQMNHEPEKQQETVSAETGVRYEGAYKNGKRNGYGVLIRPCGSRYEGEFRDDAANGFGTFYHISGDIYAGQWKDNKAHGQGRFTHADGSTYEGQWVMDVQEGYGVERWIDGSSYEGNYTAGKKNGRGRFTWPNGSTFEGQFKDNEINGEGTYQWTDGKTYTGQWVHNRMQGHGRMVLTDGGVHEGTYFQDRRHGRAAWISPAQEAEKNKYQEHAARERVAAKNGLTNVGHQQVRSTATKAVVDGSRTANSPDEPKRRVDNGRVEQRDVRENADRKKSKRKIHSSAQHSATQQQSASHYHSSYGECGSNVAGSAETNGTGRFSVNAAKADVVYSSDAVYQRRGHGHENGAGTNPLPYQQHQQQYERHLRETAEGPRREEVVGKGAKNAGSLDSTSHSAGRGSRKRAFESFFRRRR